MASGTAYQRLADEVDQVSGEYARAKSEAADTRVVFETVVTSATPGASKDDKPSCEERDAESKATLEEAGQQAAEAYNATIVTSVAVAKVRSGQTEDESSRAHQPSGEGTKKALPTEDACDESTATALAADEAAASAKGAGEVAIARTAEVVLAENATQMVVAAKAAEASAIASAETDDEGMTAATAIVATVVKDENPNFFQTALGHTEETEVASLQESLARATVRAALRSVEASFTVRPAAAPGIPAAIGLQEQGQLGAAQPLAEQGGGNAASSGFERLPDEQATAPPALATVPMSTQEEADATLEDIKQALRTNALRVVDLFKSLDLDQDGGVTIAEFRDRLPSIGIQVSHCDAIDSLFADIDLDRSGSINYQELHRLLRIRGEITLPDALQPGAAGHIETQSSNLVLLRRPDGARGGAPSSDSTLDA